MNRKTKDVISHDELLRCLHYDPDTGHFTLLIPISGKSVGGVVGHLHKYDKYVHIKIQGITYKSHRLAWFYITKSWPKDQIDHINRIRHDNRFANLREATNSENQQNKSFHRNNSSGFSGVTWHKNRKKWCARIKLNKIEYHLGIFSNLQDAVAARKAAEKKYFGEFARKEFENNS